MYISKDKFLTIVQTEAPNTIYTGRAHRASSCLKNRDHSTEYRNDTKKQSMSQLDEKLCTEDKLYVIGRAS